MFISNSNFHFKQFKLDKIKKKFKLEIYYFDIFVALDRVVLRNLQTERVLVRTSAISTFACISD